MLVACFLFGASGSSSPGYNLRPPLARRAARIRAATTIYNRPSRRSRPLIADKAYDVDSLRQWLKARRIRAAIPPPLAGPFPIRSTALPIDGAP